MMNDLKNMKGTQIPLLEKKLQRRLSRYKTLVLVEPKNAEYWYELSQVLFKLGQNEDGFKTLLNAKKLGSPYALNMLLNIVSLFGDTNPELSKKMRQEILGEEAGHV